MGSVPIVSFVSTWGEVDSAALLDFEDSVGTVPELSPDHYLSSAALLLYFSVGCDPVELVDSVIEMSTIHLTDWVWSDAPLYPSGFVGACFVAACETESIDATSSSAVLGCGALASFDRASVCEVGNFDSAMWFSGCSGAI